MASDPIRDAMRGAGGGPNPVQAAMGADENRPGPPSLFSQFKGLAGALMPGVVHMGADLGQDAYALTQLPSAVSLGILANLPAGDSVVKGLHRNRYIRPFVGEEMVVDAAQGAGFSDNMRRAFPFMASMGTSMRGTGERLVNQTAALAPGGLAAGDGAYSRASREGNILPVLVEDIGNAAIVGAVAAKGLSRAAAPAVQESQAATAAVRATAPLEAGGGTAARSAVIPASRMPRWARLTRTPRQIAREEALVAAPSPAMEAAALRGPGARVFEVGSAGPAATTQVVDDAAAAAAREAAGGAAQRALRLTRAARRTRDVAYMGDVVADLPARVFTAPIGLVGRKVVSPAARAFAATDTGARVSQYLDEKVGEPWRQHQERREWRDFMHERGQMPAVQGVGDRIGAGVRAMRTVANLEEGAAGHLIVSGVADGLGPWLDRHVTDLADQMGVTPGEARQWAIEQVLPDEGYDRVAAFDIARRYADGTLEPEAAARIDTAQEMLRESVREPRQAWFRRGRGEQQLPTPEKIRGRQEQFRDQPLSIVVEKATERIDAKIDAQVKKVIEVRERAVGADRRRVLDPQGYETSVRESVAAIYKEAQVVAADIVRQDPEVARAAAGITNWEPSVEQLVDILAGRLVSARGSRNPVLRGLIQDLKAAGYEVPFDVPNPAMFAPAERAAGGAERARIFDRQATAAEGTAGTAQRQLEDWQGRPQPIVGARPGATSTLERSAVSADRARQAAAEGPAAPDTAGLDLTIDTETPVSSVADWVDWTRMQGGEPAGQPGDLAEVAMPRANGTERAWFHYGDDGQPNAYIDVQFDADGTPTALSVAVDPAAQGQGIGLRLYDAVADAGVDVDRALANETFTPAGARLYERWRAQRGLFTDPVRRDVYDRAAGREQAVAQRRAPAEDFTPEPVDVNDPVLATDLAGVEASVRRGASDAQQQIITDIDQKFAGSRLEVPPRRRSFGQGGHTGGGEWDWYDALPENTRAVIRRRWTVPAEDPGGMSPDQLAMNYSDTMGREVDIEEAAAEWVRLVETYEAAGRIRKGMAVDEDLDLVGDQIPGATRAEVEAVGLADTQAYDVMSRTDPGRKLRSATRRYRPSRRTQLERLGRHRAEQAAADRLGPEPPTARDGRRSAWEMPVEQYAAELTAAEEAVARWADENPVTGLDDDVWVEPDEVAAARDRVNELAPDGFDDPASPLAPEDLHQKLVEAAQRHGLAGAPDGAATLDPAAAGARAVADIEQRALEAFVEDTENRAVAKLSGQRVPSEDLLYQGLNEPGRKLYRQMVRDAKVVGEDTRLELARRQLEQKLIGRGRRAQAPISRQQGRLEARERILTTAAEQARRRADTAAERVDEAASRYEVRTGAAAGGVGKFGRGQRRIGEREGAARTREADVGREERTLARLMDRRARIVEETKASPQAAPARFGTMLRAGGELRAGLEEQAQLLDDDIGAGAGDLLRTLADEIPSNIYDALALEGNGRAPEHLIGGAYSQRRGGSGVGRLDESAPYRRKAGQERIKDRTAGDTMFSIEGQVREEVKRFRDSVRNDLAHQMQAEFGVRAADKGLGELRGQALVDAMEAQGYVPWDPANPVGRGTPPPGQVNADTTFISQNASDAFGRVFGDRSRLQRLLETWYDRRFLGTLKTGWLALSPRWLVGNVVGNAMMAVIGGGIDPVTLVRHMGNARALLAEDPSGRLLERQEAVRAERGDIPRTLLNRGFTHEELTFLNPDLERPRRNPVARVAAASYRLNEFTDNVFRSAIYLAKIEPRQKLWADVEAGNISGQEFAARVRDTLGAKAALEAALHAAGDFQNLSTFERSVIKRLWIFYPWYRHITRLALSLPINHPTRTLWTLHVAQMFGNEQEQTELPPFLRGSIPLGDDRYLPTGALNPFGQVEDSPMLSPGSAVGGLTPAITWPAAIFLGLDVSRGFEDISRPPGTEKLDAYGRPTNTPLWGNFGELGRWAASQFPQGRAFFGVTEDPVLRYGQGSPVLVEGEPVPSGRTRVGAAAQLFGVPFPTTVDTDAITTRRNERTAAASTARERYYENLRRAGVGR